MELDAKPFEGKHDVAEFAWPGRARAAVTFSFDDSRFSQAVVAAPRLADLGIAATFYVIPDAVAEHLEDWHRAVEGGHEIGHHSLLHPCARDLNASNVYLEDYTLEKLEREMLDATDRLEHMLGVRPRSFAYPCGNTYVGSGPHRRSYVPLVAQLFQSGRGYPHVRGNDPLSCNMEYLRSSKLDGVSLDTALRLIDDAVRHGSWLIFTAHETPEEDTGLRDLARNVANRDELWSGTVGTVAEHILANR